MSKLKARARSRVRVLFVNACPNVIKHCRLKPSAPTIHIIDTKHYIDHMTYASLQGTCEPLLPMIQSAWEIPVTPPLIFAGRRSIEIKLFHSKSITKTCSRKLLDMLASEQIPH